MSIRRRRLRIQSLETRQLMAADTSMGTPDFEHGRLSLRESVFKRIFRGAKGDH